jgi:glycosyltransferase involved in cell wall biosynthesis
MMTISEIKILHIIDTLGSGGAQIMLKDLFEYQPVNENISLFCLRTTNITVPVNHINIQIHNSKSRYSFRAFFSLKRLISKIKPQILHCHLFRSQVYGFFLKLLFFPKIKLIFHEHGQILGSETGNSIEDKIFRFFIRISKKKVNLFFAVSEFVKVNLEQKTKVEPSKIKLLYNFIDLKKIPSIPEKKEGETNFVVGFAGRIVEGKGWRDLLKSSVYLRKNNIKIIIAGIGKDVDDLKTEISKNDLSETVKYLGYIDNIHSEFFSRINCLVIPSHKEALGIVTLEAYAHKIPVIASNINGLNEIVKHQINGLLFEVKNEKDLATKINMIFENKELGEQLTEQAYTDVLQYDIEKYLEKLKAIYDEIR